MTTHMKVGPKTKLSISLATLALIAGAIWQTAVVASSYKQIILSNATAIVLLTKALQLSNIDDETGDLKRERRSIKAKMALVDNNPRLLAEYDDQIEEINDELERNGILRTCIVETEGPCK